MTVVPQELIKKIQQTAIQPVEQLDQLPTRTFEQAQYSLATLEQTVLHGETIPPDQAVAMFAALHKTVGWAEALTFAVDRWSSPATSPSQPSNGQQRRS